MVSPVNTVSQQIPAANTFKPGESAAQKIVEQPDKFDTAPKTEEERLTVRNDQRVDESRETRRQDVTASSARGSSLDISV